MLPSTRRTSAKKLLFAAGLLLMPLNGPANAATVTIHDNADIAHTVTTTITVAGTSPSGPTSTVTGNFFQATAGTTIYDPATGNLVGGSTATGYVGSYTTTVVVPGTSTTVTQVTSTPSVTIPGGVTGSAVTIAANTNQDVSRVTNTGISSFTSYSSLAQATGEVDLIAQGSGGSNLYYSALQTGFGTYVSTRTFSSGGATGYFIDANDYSGAGNLRYTAVDAAIVLVGNNTYTGDTFLAGTAIIQGNGTIGQGTLDLATSSANAVFNKTGASVALPNAISGVGALTFMGDTTYAGGNQTTTLTYDSVNYSGAVRIETPTGAGATNMIVLGDGSTSGPTANTGTLGQTGSAGSIDIGRLDGDNAGSATTSGTYASSQLTGTAKLEFNLSGTKTIANALNFHAKTALENLGGNITVSGAVTSGANDDVSITNTGGALAFTNTLTLGSGGDTKITNNSSGNLTFSGNITSGGEIDISNNGTGNLIISGNLSGLVFINQNGAGTTTISGTNSYTGIVSVNNTGGVLDFTGPGSFGAGTIKLAGGTLQLGGAAAATLSNAVNVAASSNLQTDANLTFTGAFTSPASGIVLTKIGAASLILTGDNDTFAGTFVINQGTLQAGNGGTTGTFGVYAITDNGTVAVDRSDAQGVLINNLVSGSGNFLQLGTGLTIMTGANTYAGTTTIAAGTLQVGNGGTAGNLGAGAIIDNAALSFDRTDVVSVANAITGTGSLTQAGSGTVILTGANTYSGGTTINTGSTLQVGNGGNTGSLGAGGLANNGVLIFDLSGPLTVSGGVSGAGSITQNGSGAVTLAGGGISSGSVTVNSGSLAVTGGVLASGVYVASGATLTVGSGSADTVAKIGGASTTVNGMLNLNSGASYTLSNVTGGATSVVNQTGGGTVTLAGANNFNGGSIVISSGTVAFNQASDINNAVIVLDNGTLSYTGASAIDLSGNDVFHAVGGTLSFIDTTQTLTLGGIQHDGAGMASIRVIGGGSVIPGTLAAGVRFIGDTLDLAGSDNTSGNFNDSLNITNSSATPATFTINQSSVGTASGVIGGDLALTVAGSGTLTLTGANTYTGTTTITGATLQIGNGVTAGTLGGAAPVVDNGTLTFNRSDVVTVANAISGSGGFTQAGTGTVILTGANTYSGTTTIASGTLQVGTGGTAGAIGTGAVVNNGALIFNSANATTISGAFTGTGSLTQNGAGTLTLANASYSGATAVNAGRLVIAETAVPGGSFAVASGATLEFDGTGSSVTLSQPLTGAGALVLSGNGTTAFGSSVALTGPITVENGHTLDLGALAANNSVASSLLTLSMGSSLVGSGTLAGSLVNNGGTVSPGHSPGIITVNGNFVNNAGTLNMQIAGTASGQFDQIKYTGQAVLNGGTLNITYLNGFTPSSGQSFRLLDDIAPVAGHPAVVGAFTTVNIPSSQLISLVTTDASGLVYTVYGSVGALPGVGYSGTSSFNNAVSAAGATDPRVAAIVNILQTSGAAAAHTAFVNSSPIALGSLTTLSLDEARADSDLVRQRLDAHRIEGDALRSESYETFAQMHGEVVSAGSNDGGPTFDRNYFGGDAGIEMNGFHGMTVGAAVGYDQGYAGFHDGGGHLDQERGSLTGYISDVRGRTFYYLGAFGGYSGYQSQRDTVLGEAKGDTNGWDLGATFDVGHRFSLDKEWDITPYAGLTFSHSQVFGFSETGGSAYGLNVGDYGQDSLRFKLGTDFSWATKLGDGNIRLALTTAYERECLPNRVTVPASFTNGSTGGFDTLSNTLSTDIFTVGPQVAYMFDDNKALIVGYRVDIGLDSQIAQRFDVSISTRF